MFILLISIIGIITYRHLHFSFSFSLSKFFCICLILTINQTRSKVNLIIKVFRIIIPDSVFGVGRWRWWKSFVSVFRDDGEDRFAAATILLFRVRLRIL
uniref:Uncharacterized protein n=1 Tax=Helianthus annuus TaxID=4232 RepID=A0A251VL41_HELAN